MIFCANTIYVDTGYPSRCRIAEYDTIFSTFVGLKGYLRDKLGSLHESQAKSTATSLLRFVLSDITILNFLFVDVEILSLLLNILSPSCGESSCPEALNILRDAQYRFSGFKINPCHFSSDGTGCIQRFESRIEKALDRDPILGPQRNHAKLVDQQIERLKRAFEKLLDSRQSSPGPQSNPSKRLAQEMEDTNSMTRQSKTRRCLDHGQ